MFCAAAYDVSTSAAVAVVIKKLFLMADLLGDRPSPPICIGCLRTTAPRSSSLAIFNVSIIFELGKEAVVATQEAGDFLAKAVARVSLLRLATVAAMESVIMRIVGTRTTARAD
jgi:hypothetical protein